MSDLFVNKIAGALLASALGFIGINRLADHIVHADVPEASEFAYSLAPVEAAAVVVEVEAPFPSSVWIGAQDATKGAKVFKKCKSCHSVNDGGKNGTGPALWDIVGRAKGSADGFSYSAGMTAKGGNWGYAELDEFLTKPKNYITKTKMSFNGLKKETDRAALIEYLRLQASTPLAPLAEAAPIPGAQDEASNESSVQEASHEATPAGIEIPSETIVTQNGENVPVSLEKTANDALEAVKEKVEEHVADEAPKTGEH
jgi:cytochrome c